MVTLFAISNGSIHPLIVSRCRREVAGKFIEHARLRSDARVLDFGAGVGTLADIYFEAFVLSLLFKNAGNKNAEPSSVSLRIFDRYLLPVSKFVDAVAFGRFGNNVMAIATPAVDSGRPIA